MINNKSVEELKNYYHELFKKGVEEMPLDNITVSGVKIEKKGKNEDMYSEGDINYNCTYEGKIYPYSSSCNQDLLEFVQCILPYPRNNK